MNTEEEIPVCLYDLVRKVKAIKKAAQRGVSGLRKVLAYWHRLACEIVGPFPFREVEFTFERAWRGVRHPKGHNPVPGAFAKARTGKLPKCAERYANDAHAEELLILVAACLELAKGEAPHPFFLGCRDAARELGIHYKRANAWLRILRKDGILEVASRPARQALRYRFIGEHEGTELYPGRSGSASPRVIKAGGWPHEALAMAP